MSIVDLSFIKPTIIEDSTLPSVVIVSKTEAPLSIDRPTKQIRTFIAGKRWYFLLKQREASKCKSLSDIYDESELVNMLVVCYEPSKDTRLFTAFKDYLEFYTYSNKFVEDGRFFHEVVLSEADQKPRFDIDVKDVDDVKATSQACVDELITCIVDEMKEIGLTISIEHDILVFNSSDAKKGSFHIIVDNYKHPNHVEARTLAHRIINRMKDYKGYVDDQIYSSKHNLRIVGSYKQGSVRQKRWMPSFTYLGQTITHKWTTDIANENLDLAVLEHSLVTAAAGCKLLPLLNVEVKPVIKQSDLPDDVVDKALDIFFEKQGERKSLKMAEIVGHMIILRRQATYKCLKCNVGHESENPFLTVSSKGGVYFNCRRRPGGVHIGWILGGIDDVVPSNVDQPVKSDGEFIFFKPTEESVVTPSTQLMSHNEVMRNLLKARPPSEPLPQSTAKQGAEKGSLSKFLYDMPW